MSIRERDAGFIRKGFPLQANFFLDHWFYSIGLQRFDKGDCQFDPHEVSNLTTFLPVEWHEMIELLRETSSPFLFHIWSIFRNMESVFSSEHPCLENDERRCLKVLQKKRTQEGGDMGIYVYV